MNSMFSETGMKRKGAAPDEDSSDEDSSDEDSSDESETKRARLEVTQKVKNEYVYRIMRFDENYLTDLRPKDIFSRTSLQMHVEEGSKGVKSRFISCSKSMSGLMRLGRLTNMSARERDVVRINITKIDKDEVKVIDLTDEATRKRHIRISSRAWEFAEKYEEVILEPNSHVPKECVEKIGKIHHRSFVKDEHVEPD